MAFELKDGHGTLHKNDKDGVENRPDYKGSLLIGDVKYRLSAWIKTSANGKWMSLSAQPEDAAPKTKPAQKKDDLDDDIPF